MLRAQLATTTGILVAQLVNYGEHESFFAGTLVVMQVDRADDPRQQLCFSHAFQFNGSKLRCPVCPCRHTEHS